MAPLDAVKVAVLVVVPLALAATVGVVAIESTHSDFEKDEFQEEGEVIQVKGNLDSKLNDVVIDDIGNNTANITMFTHRGAKGIQFDFEGQTVTRSFEDGNVTVTFQNAISDTEAEILYESKRTAFWSSATTGLVSLIGVLLFVMILLAYLGVIVVNT